MTHILSSFCWALLINIITWITTTFVAVVVIVVVVVVVEVEAVKAGSLVRCQNRERILHGHVTPLC